MAKRISSSSVNWSLIREMLPPVDAVRVEPLKIATDNYLRQIATKPAELPKIDWDLYKLKIRTPGVLDSFQKSYENLKIPYPSDQGALAETEKYNGELLKHALDIIDKLTPKIKELQKTLTELESVMKYSDMTLEEYYMVKATKSKS